jgi:hypothetical protein
VKEKETHYHYRKPLLGYGAETNEAGNIITLHPTTSHAPMLYTD